MMNHKLSQTMQQTPHLLYHITAPTPPVPSLMLKPATFILKQLASGGNHFTGSRRSEYPADSDQ